MLLRVEGNSKRRDEMNYNLLKLFAGNTKVFTGWAAYVAADGLKVALWKKHLIKKLQKIYL